MAKYTQLYMINIKMENRQTSDTLTMKEKFNKIIRLIHPDKCSDPYANRATTALLSAWKILNNEKERVKYETVGEKAFPLIDWSEMRIAEQFIKTKLKDIEGKENNLNKSNNADNSANKDKRLGEVYPNGRKKMKITKKKDKKIE